MSSPPFFSSVMWLISFYHFHFLYHSLIHIEVLVKRNNWSECLITEAVSITFTLYVLYCCCFLNNKFWGEILFCWSIAKNKFDLFLKILLRYNWLIFLSTGSRNIDISEKKINDAYFSSLKIILQNATVINPCPQGLIKHCIIEKVYCFLPFWNFPEHLELVNF